MFHSKANVGNGSWNGKVHARQDTTNILALFVHIIYDRITSIKNKIVLMKLFFAQWAYPTYAMWMHKHHSEATQVACMLSMSSTQMFSPTINNLCYTYFSFKWSKEFKSWNFHLQISEGYSESAWNYIPSIYTSHNTITRLISFGLRMRVYSSAIPLNVFRI